MIQWPNIGLFGEFQPCEAGILEAINKNMFILDLLVQMSVIDFVDELPDNPDPGDRYILEDGAYSYTGGPNSIMVFDGDEWRKVDPRPGYLAYVESQSAYFWYNGTDWQVLPTNPLQGPGSSLNNSIARFDGVTGQLITDSGVILDDDNVISSVYAIYSETSVSDVAKLKRLDVMEGISSASGANQNLPAPTFFVTRYNGALTSVSSIAAPPSGLYGSLFILSNNTGGDLTLNNGPSIRTGTGANLKVENGAAVFALYDVNDDQWVIVGGSGGGGSGILSVPDIPARDAIDVSERYVGLIVYVDDPEFRGNYQLQGGIANSNWKKLKSPRTNQSKNYIPDPNGENGPTTYKTYSSVHSFVPGDVNTTTDLITNINFIGNQNFYNGLRVQVYSNTTLPAGLAITTDYYIRDYNTSTGAFGLSATKGGALVNITSQGSGTHYLMPSRPTYCSPGIPSATNVDWDVTLLNPLSQIAGSSLLFEVDATSYNMGQGGAKAFSIDTSSTGKMHRISGEFKVNSGTYSNNSLLTSASGEPELIVYIWDIINNKVIEPSAIFLNQIPTSAGASTFTFSFQAEFQATEQRDYYLLFHCANTATSSFVMKMGELSVSPNVPVFGSNVSVRDMGPTAVGATGTPPTKSSSIQYDKVIMYQTGNRAKFKMSYEQVSTGATDGGAGVHYLIGFPGGLQVDTALQATNGGTTTVSKASQRALVGRGNVFTSGSNFSVGVYLYDATRIFLVLQAVGATTNGVWGQGYAPFGQGLGFDIEIEVPILGWAASTQAADQTTSRRVAAKYYCSTNFAATTTTPCNYNTKVYDDVGMVTPSPTGWKAIAKAPGIYRFAIRGVGASASGSVYVRAYLNGQPYGMIAQTTGWNTLNAGGYIDIPMIVDDYVDIRPNANCTFTGGLANADTTSVIDISMIQGPSQIMATETVAARYTTAVATAYSSTVPLNYNVRDYDSHNAVTVSPTAWRFTAPISGLYLVNASATNSAGSGNDLGQICKNGAPYATATSAGWTVGSGGGQVNTTVRLKKDEYIDYRNLTVTTRNTTADATMQRIEILRVGNYV